MANSQCEELIMPLFFDMLPVLSSMEKSPFPWE